MDESFRSVIKAMGVAALGGVLLLAGCAAPTTSSMTSGSAVSGTVASEVSQGSVRRVGFLTDYARLRPMVNGGGTLCWKNADVDWKKYDKVMFERIQVYLKDSSNKPVDPTDLKMLIDYFHSDLVKAMQPVAQVVNAPGPGVLRVRFALTDLVPTNGHEPGRHCGTVRFRRRNRLGRGGRQAGGIDAVPRPDRDGSPVSRWCDGCDRRGVR